MGEKKEEFPHNFKKEYVDCKGNVDCERKVRKDFRSFESGRYYEMADKIHSFISHLSTKDFEAFKKKYPQLVEVANEFGIIEELATFKLEKCLS
jgi:hypothetical protein